MHTRRRWRDSGKKSRNVFLETLEPRTLFSVQGLFLGLEALLLSHWRKQQLPPPPADAPAPPAQQALAGANSATVAGRDLFYAGSDFDLGQALGGIGPGGDDHAIALDKSALLPGQTASFANFSSYQLGINGLMIDLAGTIGTLTAADFVFRVGNDPSAPASAGAAGPGDWISAPAPISLTERPGAGAAGSNRVEITWADHAIQNQWLQVTVLADANTGLATNDVSYFGNLVGDTGNAAVDLADETAARNNPASFLNPAAIDNPCDFNRDGRVDANDQLIARGNAGTSLALFSLAAAPPPPPPTVSYDWHEATLNGVLNVWAPDPSDFGATWTVNPANPLAALYGSDGLPSMTAIHQGQIADCYLLAALGGMANSHPAQIQSLVSWDGSGWAVTWHDAGTGVALVVHTANDFSQYYQANTGEIWWDVFEKTYATFRTWNGITGANTLSSIGWGYSGVVLSQLATGSQTVNTLAVPLTATFATLQNDLAAGHVVLFQTAGGAPTMVQSHVYIITSAYIDGGGTQWITTYNPWGFYDTRTITDLLQNGVGSLLVGTA